MPANGVPQRRSGPAGPLRGRWRDARSVVALHVVVAGHHLGGGPFQRLALLALALGLLDGIDVAGVDLARGDLAQRQHGRFVVGFAVVQLGLHAASQLARTLGRHHHEFEAVVDHLQAVFDGNPGHVCPAASGPRKRSRGRQV